MIFCQIVRNATQPLIACHLRGLKYFAEEVFLKIKECPSG